MSILLDTSVLIAYAELGHIKHPEVSQRVQGWLNAEVPLLLAPQVVFEFYVVATRPQSVNGLGLLGPEAFTFLDSFTKAVLLLADPPELLTVWRQLVQQYGVSGKPAHDARLAAWMLATGVPALYTLNTADFRRYEPQIQLC